MSELNFKGKEFVYNHHLAVPFRPLEPHAKKGIGAVALDGNLIIHGDNLHALKALLPIYAGKVDCVFIDPPYNTGNEGWMPRRMGEFLKQFGAAADSSAACSMKKFVAGRWEGEIVRLRFRLSGIRREVPMPNAKDLLGIRKR